MNEAGKVLLVYQNGELFDGLTRVLQALGLGVTRTRSCAELRSQVRNGAEYLAVFVEEGLSDGTWRDVHSAASRASDPMPVIVVSPVVDINEYIDTMESGASDYVVPPFLGTDIAHVLMAAVGKTQTRAGWRPLSQHIASGAC
jgi:DNA-binding NtrC family response regulator